MTWDASSKRRLNRQRTTEVAELLHYKRRLNLRVMPALDNISANQLSKLETENTELRRRAAELALEIQTLRGG
jgi:hypothetical protein